VLPSSTKTDILEPFLRKAIGLDFGTTNSAFAIARPDGNVELARFGAQSTFRSILFFEADICPARRRFKI